MNERDECRGGAARVRGNLAAGGAAWPASSCARAHRRGPLPATPLPRTRRAAHPHRNAPYISRRASRPSQSSGTGQADRRAKGHRGRTGTMPRIVRVGSSSLNGASHPRAARTRLRRAVDPGDLGRPCGPDGEGQAEGPGPIGARRKCQIRTAGRTAEAEHSRGIISIAAVVCSILVDMQESQGRTATFELDESATRTLEEILTEIVDQDSELKVMMRAEAINPKEIIQRSKVALREPSFDLASKLHELISAERERDTALNKSDTWYMLGGFSLFAFIGALLALLVVGLAKWSGHLLDLGLWPFIVASAALAVPTVGFLTIASFREDAEKHANTPATVIPESIMRNLRSQLRSLIVLPTRTRVSELCGEGVAGPGVAGDLSGWGLAWPYGRNPGGEELAAEPGEHVGGAGLGLGGVHGHSRRRRATSAGS